MSKFVELTTRMKGKTVADKPLDNLARLMKTYEQMVLSDLRAVEQLPPAVQRAIAADVAGFINMAGISDALLNQFLAAAMQERHQALSDGAASNRDPRWASASLKEAWCGAKLGRTRGAISESAAMAIMRNVEEFAFSPKHQGT
jgi:hypothetical protein